MYVCQLSGLLCGRRQRAGLLCGVAGETYAQFFENLVINFAQHYCRVYLTSVELRQHFQGTSAILVVSAEH